MSLYSEMVRQAEDANHDAVTVSRPQPDRAIVTLNEPEHLNALSAAVCVGLNRTLDQLAFDHELRTIILTGAGDAFSAGGDLAMMEEFAEPNCFTTAPFQEAVASMRGGDSAGLISPRPSARRSPR